MTILHPEFEEATTRALREFLPPPDLTMSEWADNNRVLSKESSAEPGPWNTDRFPPVREVMDTISDPTVETVVLMFSAQASKTEIMLNTIGYFADQDPSSMLMVQYSLEMAEVFSKDRLAPMIRDSAALSKRFSDTKSRDGNNTILHKAFIGGQIAIAGANSPGSLASRPVRLVLFDEVDRYPASAGTEGDPVALGEERTETFYNRKIVMASTPGNEDESGAEDEKTSRIKPAYEETDQRKFFVPCPHCGHMQVLIWHNFEFQIEEGKTAHEIAQSVVYRCEAEGCKILPSQREWMVARGEWRATAVPKRHGAVGFHMWRAYSPWSSWPKIVERFLLAKGNRQRMKVFTNTVLAETFKTDGLKMDDIDLYNRREKYEKVPDAAKVLLATVDHQDDRLELLVTAWGEKEEMWAVDHVIVYGNPAQEEVWDKMAVQLQELYEREDGYNMKIRAFGVDTGGHHTTMAYKFCAKYKHLNVLALKGHSSPGQPVIARGKKLHRHGILLYMVGSDTIKDTLFARLPMKAGEEGCMHFPWQFDPEFFAQVTSEKRVTKYRHGIPYSVYIKTRARNEALDMLVYSHAVLAMLNMKLDECSPDIQQPAAVERQAATVAPVVRQGGFIKRPTGSFIKQRS